MNILGKQEDKQNGGISKETPFEEYKEVIFFLLGNSSILSHSRTPPDSVALPSTVVHAHF